MLPDPYRRGLSQSPGGFFHRGVIPMSKPVLPNVGILSIRPRSLLLQHFLRHLTGDRRSSGLTGIITCNGVIAGPRYAGEPVLFGEGFLYTAQKRQVSCFPGARFWHCTSEAGEIKGKALLLRHLLQFRR